MKTIFGLFTLLITVICVCSECNSDRNTTPKFDPQAPSVKVTWQKWTKKNSILIESLSDDNFNDLHFLQELIGDRTLIQLGESSHGVKEFNQMRVRIIKYLHEKMGFNIIAFESGLFECYNSNKGYSQSPRNMIEAAIFSVWKTEEVLELFKYIVETRETNKPLLLAGFDFQMSGDWTERSYMLKEMVSEINQDFASELYKTDSLFAVNKKPNDIDAMRKYVFDNQIKLKHMYSHFEMLIDTNMPELTDKYQSNPMIPLFAHQIAVSMLDYIDFWLDEENEMSIRDRAMADNVDFLKRVVYPDEKIIIWAHNLHIRHNNDLLDQDAYNKIKSMGGWLHERYFEELYTIGLYMYKGKGTYVNREVYNVKRPSPNSLESILHSAGHKISFVDLKYSKPVAGNDWMVSEIPTKTWGLEDLKMIPANQYDAIIFIDSISPPDYLD